MNILMVVNLARFDLHKASGNSCGPRKKNKLLIRKRMLLGLAKAFVVPKSSKTSLLYTAVGLY